MTRMLYHICFNTREIQKPLYVSKMIRNASAQVACKTLKGKTSFKCSSYKALLRNEFVHNSSLKFEQIISSCEVMSLTLWHSKYQYQML